MLLQLGFVVFLHYSLLLSSIINIIARLFLTGVLTKNRTLKEDEFLGYLWSAAKVGADKQATYGELIIL
jgi:hypothetical protein